MSRVLVTGASGLVGRATVERLVASGHDPVAASRTPGESTWPDGVETVRYRPGGPLPTGMDAIINLAGASIGGRRWSKTYKQELVQSRLQVTRAAVEARPDTLVQASAIGYYGINPDGVCTEGCPAGDDFLADLCKQWEAEAAAHKGRCVVFRSGHVLDDGHEGILGRLAPLYRVRLGGRIGSGKQGLPWVHVQDAAKALVWAVETNAAEGPYNLAAPDHVTQGEFNKEFAKALGVAAPWWIPGIAMRVAAGGLGPYLVGGQRTPPDRLLEAGFRFDHPDLPDALHDLFGDVAGGQAGAATNGRSDDQTV